MGIFGEFVFFVFLVCWLVGFGFCFVFCLFVFSRMLNVFLCFQDSSILCFFGRSSCFFEFLMKGSASSHVFVFELRFSFSLAEFTDWSLVTLS